MSEYKKLQNGSDIRGIAIDGIDGEKPNLTPKEASSRICEMAAGEDWKRRCDDRCWQRSASIRAGSFRRTAAGFLQRRRPGV